MTGYKGRMRAVIQRVEEAQVEVGNEVVGRIGTGLCVLVGVTHEDGVDQTVKMASKIAGLRVFDDADGVMNLGLVDVGGAALVVSQFTLYGDAAKGRRPSYVRAARPEHAEPLIERLVAELEAKGVTVETGRFRADMRVSLVNDGPVTIIVDV